MKVAERKELADQKNGKYKQLVTYCLKLFDSFSTSSYRKARNDEIDASYKAYKQVSDAKSFPWEGCSNNVLPYTMITVDSLEPRLLAGVTGAEPYVDFGPKDDLEEAERAYIDTLEKWFNDELKLTVRWVDTARRIVHRLLMEGSAFVEPQYIKRDKKRRIYEYDEEAKRTKINQETKTYQTADENETVFEGGEVNLLPWTDCYWPDDVGTIEEWEECDKVIIRRYTYAELMRNNGTSGWMNIDADLLPFKKKKEAKSPNQKAEGVEVTGKEVIECLECHVLFPVAAMTDKEDEEKERKNWEEERFIVTIAKESQIVVRFRNNIDPCFTNDSIVKRVRLYGNDDETCGYPVFSKMKSIQEGASDFFNRFMDMVVITMIPWYFYKKGKGITGPQTLFPGKGIGMEEPREVVFPRFSLGPGEFAFVNEIFKDLWARAVSIDDPQLGRASDKGSTATEILSIIQEGNIKHEYMAKSFKDEILALLKGLYDMYYQWMPDDEVIKFQNETVQFPREAMRRFNMFRLTGSTAQANALIERKEAEDLSMIVTSNPAFASMANPMTLLEDILKTYGKENAEKYINPVIGAIMQMYQIAPDETEAALQQVAEALQQQIEGQENA